MKPTNKSREQAAGAVSLFLGLTVAAALKVGFLMPAAAPEQAQGSTTTKPTAVRVRAKVKVAAQPTAPVAHRATPAPSPKAPPAVRQVTIQSEAATVARTPPAEPPRVETAPSIALEQPARVLRTEASVPDVPSLPVQTVQPNESVAATLPEPLEAEGIVGAATGRPDAPPDDYAPPPEALEELKDGGNVLILGLLLDSKGRLQDVKKFVRSYNTASDDAWALSAVRKQVFTDIYPPIPPGELRWIKSRVDYPPQTVAPNILP